MLNIKQLILKILNKLSKIFNNVLTGDMQSNVTDSGIYYIANAVTNKPDSTGGMLILDKGNTNTGSGLYIPNEDTPSLYKVSIVDGNWHYRLINSCYLTKVTDCNNATDPNVTYYTDSNTSNLNRPIANWCVIRSLFLNGNPSSGNAWSCMQIGMPMNSTVPDLYLRSKAVNGSWGAWKKVTYS